jgi:phosphonate transport system substrate-binding protein
MIGDHNFDVRRAFFALAILTTLAPAQEKSVNLTFGVYTTDKPTVMYRTFTPLIEALERSMEKRLSQPVAIELRIFKSYTAARTALVKGHVDFVRFGPASYVLAKQENPKVQLLAMETKKGKKTFKGYIVVLKDSPIRSLSQVRGKRFAFGDPNSTIGRYLAQKALMSVGIHANDLSKFKFLGRHDKVFHSVLLGRSDAGALKAGTFNKLNKKGQLRIVASFNNVTKPWVARSGLGHNLHKTLAVSLISLKDPVALKSLKATSLVPSRDQDYAVIRESMKAAKKFDLPAARPTKKPRPAARPEKD